MTPREGVEPVAWGVRRGSDGAIVSALMSHANAIRGAEEIAGVDLEDAYTAVPLYAHPAATAREEAFYEAALAYFESDKARMAAFTGEVFIEGPESAAIAEAGKRLGAARAAYAALALARSVKGTEA